jgi:hypothetical protein
MVCRRGVIMEMILDYIVEFMQFLYPYLLAIMPALTAMGTCAAAVVFICKQFKGLRKDVADKTDLREARAEMKQIISEDRMLKRRLDKLIELESKVKNYDTNKEI